MRVLVTGGAGYVGSVSVEAFVAAGHDVIVLDDLSKGHRTAVDPAARLVEGSYGDPGFLRALLRDAGVEAVLHCAARSLVGESIANPALYYRENVVGGVVLLEALREAGDAHQCAEADVGHQLVVERTDVAGEEELFKARAKEKGQVKLIDIITARLDAGTDSFLATLPSLQLKDVRLICELAESLGFHSPTLDNCRAQWEKLVHEEGRGDVDHSGLFLLYDKG